MAIAQVTAGNRIVTSDLNAFYNLLKGVSGSGETVTLIYNAAGALIFQPSSDPATGTEMVQIKNNAGTVQGALSSDGKIYLADGTASVPGLSFESDKDTGIYRSGANAMKVTAGGVDVAPLAIATATVAGFVPAPPNNTTTFLRGDATWAAPTAGLSGGQVAQATITADITTTSATFVDATGLTATITTTGGNVHITFSAGITCSAVANVNLVLVKDGTVVTGGSKGNACVSFPNANNDSFVGFTWLDVAPSAASHTYKVQWDVTGGTGTIRGNPVATLDVVEFPH